MLAVMGSLAGIAAARALLQLLTKQLAALPIVLPHLQRVSLNGRVLAFNAVLCLLLAVVCSLAPILLAVRTDLQAVMRGGQAAREAARFFAALLHADRRGSGLGVPAAGGLRPDDPQPGPLAAGGPRIPSRPRAHAARAGGHAHAAASDRASTTRGRGRWHTTARFWSA